MRHLTLGFGFALLSIAPASNAAESFSPVAVPQAAGYVDTAMTVEDTMTVINRFSGATSMLSKAAASTAGNLAFTVQFGSYNNAEVQQAGAHNVSYIAQTGYYNSAMVQQSGAGHQSVVLQKGVGNTAVVTQR